MPGFEIDRFVNLSETEKNEFSCGICQDIFRNPVVTNCCQQTFCEDCINDWLKTNNSCPYDRKLMSVNQLSRPPRLLINLLGKLKIMCDYRENGCEYVLMLENLTQHLHSCDYNVIKCEKCFCITKRDHDCVKALLEMNKKTNEENNELKSKCKSLIMREEPLIQELAELKLEKENFLKTIQDISIVHDSKISKSSETTDQEILNEARKYLSCYEIIENKTENELTNEIVAIVINEIGEFHNELFDVCKNIVFKLNLEFGRQWHCFASYNRSSRNFIVHQNPFLIKLKFGKLSLEIYKSIWFDFRNMKRRFLAGKIEREITILESVIKENITSELLPVTISAIENSKNLSEITDHIVDEMNTKFGDTWQCFVYSQFGEYNVNYEAETFIRYKIGELKVILFQEALD